MGWIDPTEHHEGYIRTVFADGAHGWADTAVGPQLISLEGESLFDENDRPIARPASQVVGWKVACECRPLTMDSFAEVKMTHTVLEPLWSRVFLKEQEDLDKHLIYAGPPEDEFSPAHLDDRDFTRHEVIAALLGVWKQHVLPDNHFDIIQARAREVEAAVERLNRQVLEARADGLNWQRIGDAAGMTRQSARQRWGVK